MAQSINPGLRRFAFFFFFFFLFLFQHFEQERGSCLQIAAAIHDVCHVYNCLQNQWLTINFLQLINFGWVKFSVWINSARINWCRPAYCRIWFGAAEVQHLNQAWLIIFLPFTFLQDEVFMLWGRLLFGFSRLLITI